MNHPHRVVRTPVLLFFDLPGDKRRGTPGNLRNAVASREVRCQARSRGDSYTAKKRGVDPDGGYQCTYKAFASGLCGRHYARADTIMIERAALMFKWVNYQGAHPKDIR